MPLYEFECEECGVFEMFRSVSEASSPAACPECKGEAARVWSVPRISAVSPLQRMAGDRNERSRHAPHVCKTGCGCHGHKKSSSNQGIETANGQRRLTYKGARPWVIEHG